MKYTIKMIYNSIFSITTERCFLWKKSCLIFCLQNSLIKMSMAQPSIFYLTKIPYLFPQNLFKIRLVLVRQLQSSLKFLTVLF